MRAILFRGKQNNPAGQWAHGFLLKYPVKVGYNGESPWHIVIPPRDPEDHAQVCTVDPETVGQYTGLADNNGKAIFEGDILQFTYAGGNKGVEGKAAVVFKNGKFGVLWGWHKELVPLDGFANTVMKVVGNIHDNPELLEG